VSVSGVTGCPLIALTALIRVPGGREMGEKRERSAEGEKEKRDVKETKKGGERGREERRMRGGRERRRQKK
jgi:hypothetical protein